ncbi:MAG: hypothetical protein ACFFAY_09575 [Promethearchaeota archaeon]
MTGTKANQTSRIRELFEKELERIGRKGLLGIAKFSDVYSHLMPVQKDAMRELCESAFDNLVASGSIVSIALAYDEGAIKSIDPRSDGQINVERWNIYAAEYRALNAALNSIAETIANQIQGIAVPATWIKKVDELIDHVQDYFDKAISHRAIAELAGMGWRGKNGLIVNRHLSCAIRFASIIVPFELEYNQEESLSCGECVACENACSYIRNRDILSDYREYCRRYINYLQRIGVENAICGKCIKACYFNSEFQQQFELEVRE